MKKAFLINIDLVRRVVVDVPEEEINENELADIICKELSQNCHSYAKDWAVDLAENVMDIKEDREIPYGSSKNDGVKEIKEKSELGSLKINEVVMYEEKLKIVEEMHQTQEGNEVILFDIQSKKYQTVYVQI